MDWRVKGVVQRVLGVVPGGERLHYVLQRRNGVLRVFETECDIKIDDWRLMMGHLHRAGVRVEGTTFFEIGTGWYPTFPLLLYLAGAARVITYDLNTHLRPHLLLQAAQRMHFHLALIARMGDCDRSVLAIRHAELVAALQRGASLADATRGVVEYRAPADAARTGLPDASVDVVFSNSVLEHVPPDVIDHCFAESMRILRPGGLVFHSVNCGDHYAYIDRRINQLHYLQYSDDAWERWNNPFLYQNRLRASDFTAAAAAAGFAIEVDTSRPHPNRLRQLEALEVDPALAARYSRDQLAITSIDFIGRKEPLAAASSVTRDRRAATHRE
jgi:SAM-dependent methyltransferase